MTKNRRQAFIDGLITDFEIKDERPSPEEDPEQLKPELRDALARLLDEAGYIYDRNDKRLIDAGVGAYNVIETDIGEVKALRKLRVCLPPVIDLLGEALGNRLVNGLANRLIDDLAKWPSRSFGPGINGPEPNEYSDAWEARRSDVEHQLHELIGRLMEINLIAEQDHKALRRSAPTGAAITEAILPFWRNYLKRKVTADVGDLINKRLELKKSRADWFAHDVMLHLRGEDAAQQVAEVMKDNTDAAIKTAKAKKLGLPVKPGRGKSK